MNRAVTFLCLCAALCGACDSTPSEPAPKRDEGGMGKPASTAVVKPAADKPAADKPTADKPTAAPAKTPSPLPEPDPKLLAPDKATAKAPDKFKVKFHTTKGDFVVLAHRDWAPIGVDRFYNLVQIGFFTDIAMFRVVPGFVVQFGIAGHPKVSAAWRNATIKDEKVKEGNKRMRLTYAKGGPDSRTTQLFISFKDNDNLDAMGFPAIGEVAEGAKVVDSIDSEYGERPNQGAIQTQGNAYLRQNFPNLDYIKSAEIIK